MLLVFLLCSWWFCCAVGVVVVFLVLLLCICCVVGVAVVGVLASGGFVVVAIAVGKCGSSVVLFVCAQEKWAYNRLSRKDHL